MYRLYLTCDGARGGGPIFRSVSLEKILHMIETMLPNQGAGFGLRIIGPSGEIPFRIENGKAVEAKE